MDEDLVSHYAVLMWSSGETPAVALEVARACGLSVGPGQHVLLLCDANIRIDPEEDFAGPPVIRWVKVDREVVEAAEAAHRLDISSMPAVDGQPT